MSEFFFSKHTQGLCNLTKLSWSTTVNFTISGHRSLGTNNRVWTVYIIAAFYSIFVLFSGATEGPWVRGHKLETSSTGARMLGRFKTWRTWQGFGGKKHHKVVKAFTNTSCTVTHKMSDTLSRYLWHLHSLLSSNAPQRGVDANNTVVDLSSFCLENVSDREQGNLWTHRMLNNTLFTCLFI